MEALSEAGYRLADRLKDVLKKPIVIKKINNLTYLFQVFEYDLTIFYYLPGSSRIFNGPTNFSGSIQIHLDEDIWLSKPTLLINRILVLTGNGKRVFARLCVVARIDKKTASDFQNEHHLQGELSGKYRYGLFFEGELIASAVFSGGRLMRHTENYRSFECLSFCTKQQFSVIGGLSKLLKAFSRDFRPNDIMTYVDRDWSDGKKFEKLGFKKIIITDPQCFLVNKITHKRLPMKNNEVLFNSDSFYQVANSGSIKMINYYEGLTALSD